jgi:putative membrane protein insertion efficiency factor
LFAIRLYQVFLSPLLGGACRFHPTCSKYACEAIKKHGAFYGTWLSLRRLARCHPFSEGGFDPVPEPRVNKKALMISLWLALCLVFLVLPKGAGAGEPPPVREDLGEQVVEMKREGVFVAQFSTYLATVRSFLLLEDRFDLRNKTPPATLPKPPDYKYQDGHKDMITTWDPPFFPFALHIESIKGAPKVRRHIKSDPVHPTIEGDFWSVYAKDPVFTVVEAKDNLVRMVWPDPSLDESTLFIERVYKDGGDTQTRYGLSSRLLFWNFGENDVQGRVRIAITAFDPVQRGRGTCGGMFSVPPDNAEVVAYVGGSLQKMQHGKIIGREEGLGTAPDFVGVNWRYFLLALAANDKGIAQALGAANEYGAVAGLAQLEDFVLRAGKDACIPSWLQAKGGLEGRMRCEEAMALLGVREGFSLQELQDAFSKKKAENTGQDDTFSRAFLSLVPGRTKTYSFDLFIGPKDIEELKSAQHALDKTIDFWVLGFLCKPMLYFLRWCYDLIPSWGLAIILLTLLVKLITIYPTQKSMTSMRRLSQLKPEIDKIRERFKDKPTEMNKAMMELYKREKVNPFGGCLPMLLQMPIWIALYRTIYSAVDLYQAPLFLWVQDLSAPDPYFVLPLLLGVLMFFQQKSSPTTTDQTQAKVMLWLMPIMFTAFMLFLPSGLVFYILVNTVLSLIHQWLLRTPRIATVKGEKGGAK